MNTACPALTFIFFMIFSVSHAQSSLEDWEGEWSGTLEIFNKDSTKNMTVPMELHIIPKEKEGHWEYTIIYGRTEDVRKYELIHISDNHYQIDEKNSIILDSYYLNDRFLEVFEVGDSFLTISTALKGGKIIYEVYSASKKSPSKTGGDDVFIVTSYPVGSFQRAILEKKQQSR